jgi:hypothetical protein
VLAQGHRCKSLIGPRFARRNFSAGNASLTGKERSAVNANMNSNGKSWLDLYVDAMLEKDPYKRLALVRKLRSVPRQGEAEDVVWDEVPLRRSSKAVRRGTGSRQR